jgi:hypothetical protein
MKIDLLAKFSWGLFVVIFTLVHFKKAIITANEDRAESKKNMLYGMGYMIAGLVIYYYTFM